MRNSKEDSKGYNFSYYAERSYPYAVSIFITIIIWMLNNKLSNAIFMDEGFEKMVESSINVVTIIIGFLGAILPVILSMKNEVEVVNYLFEEVDKDQLFKKYIVSTIYMGIMTLFISSIIFVKGSFDQYERVYKIINITWIFFYIVFLLSTLRSMTHMVNVIFINKKNSRIEKEVSKEITEEEENDLIKEYSYENNQVVEDTFSSIEKIKEYKKLLDDGIMTEEEFDEKKKELLGI